MTGLRRKKAGKRDLRTPIGDPVIPVKERERVSGKVSNQRFVNSCLANSPSVYIYTVIRTL